MGMFYCRDCKEECGGSAACRFCGSTNTYKFWWTFPSKNKDERGVKIFYDEEGKELRRVSY